MEITYNNRKLKKICTIACEAEKKFGAQMAEKIHQRIDQIAAAETVEDLVRFEIGGCHPLKGTRQGQYAMKLVQPYRLVFKNVDDTIDIVCILEVVDYH